LEVLLALIFVFSIGNLIKSCF